MGKKLGKECGAFMTLISALITKNQETLPLRTPPPMYEDTLGKVPSVKLQKHPYQEPSNVGTQLLDS